MKETIKILSSFAHSNGREQSLVFTDFLDYLIGTFSLENIISHKANMASVLADRFQEGSPLFSAMARWIEKTDEGIKNEGCFDFFGSLYEEMFLSKTKASAMGQFFTPMSLCRMMARAVMPTSLNRVNEPSCGSGRNVLALFAESDKTKYQYYICEDLDPTSVKMCALNMMIHGMLGSVICHDSLIPNSFHFGYEINEVRYPFPVEVYSIRPITSEEYALRTKSSKEDISVEQKITPKPHPGEQLTLF